MGLKPMVTNPSNFSSPITQQCSPLIGLCVLFDNLVPRFNQFLQIGIEIKFIDQFTDPAIRCFVGNDVDNDCAVIRRFKEMLVLKRFKIAFDHFVSKCFKRLHLGDLGCKKI